MRWRTDVAYFDCNKFFAVILDQDDFRKRAKNSKSFQTAKEKDPAFYACYCMVLAIGRWMTLLRDHETPEMEDADVAGYTNNVRSTLY